MGIIEAGNRAVIEELASLVTPTAIHYLAHFELQDVLDHDTGKKCRGIGPVHFIFEQGGDVDQTGGVSKRIIFPVGIGVVGAHREIA